MVESVGHSQSYPMGNGFRSGSLPQARLRPRIPHLPSDTLPTSESAAHFNDRSRRFLCESALSTSP